jgi:hypothetical protein
MTHTNTISVGTILWSVMRNPLANDLNYDEAAEFAIEAIRLIGAPVLYGDKLAEVKIENHKGHLPDDILSIRAVRDIESNTAFREATNTFHASENHREFTEFTYTAQKRVITTSMEEGCLEVSYQALLTDENGYPLIVDNAKLKLAIEYYILHRFLEPLFMMGKITDKAFNYVEQKRHFYMGSAATNLQMPSADKMESIMNGINRLITNETAHSTFFKNYGNKETIKKFR